MKKFLIMLCGIILPALTHAWGPELCNADIAITTGYRSDSISTTIRAFDPPEDLIVIDDLKGSGIDIFEVGIKGRVLLLESLFARGHANYGWVLNGRFTDLSSLPDVFSATTKAPIDSGHTKDYSIGAGFQFSFLGCFKIGPVAGYSYNFQKIKLGKAKTEGERNPVLDRLTYDMCWEGPWLGAEAQFCLKFLQLIVGYEYHLSNWHANFTLDGPDVFGGSYSDKRKSNHAHGNVVFLEGNCAWGCWTIGVGVKYQEWTAENGREVPRAGSFSAVGLNDTEVDKVPHATWRSTQIYASVGYLF